MFSCASDLHNMSDKSGIPVKVVPTKPIDGQKPGTSGLRKKVYGHTISNGMDLFAKSPGFDDDKVNRGLLGC